MMPQRMHQGNSCGAVLGPVGPLLTRRSVSGKSAARSRRAPRRSTDPGQSNPGSGRLCRTLPAGAFGILHPSS
eukprot:794233-Pyramimonas_sp.AAC.1